MKIQIQIQIQTTNTKYEQKYKIHCRRESQIKSSDLHILRPLTILHACSLPHTHKNVAPFHKISHSTCMQLSKELELVLIAFHNLKLEIEIMFLWMKAFTLRSEF